MRIICLETIMQAVTGGRLAEFVVGGSQGLAASKTVGQPN